VIASPFGTIKEAPPERSGGAFFVSGPLREVYDRRMTRRLLALAACALLAACDGTADEPTADAAPAAKSEAAVTPSAPVSPVSTPSPTAPAEPAMELAGEYRIAGVDGGDIDLPHGITAVIGEDRIDVTSQCVEMAWSYSLEGTTLQTMRIPVVTCDRGRYPEEEAIEAAFTAAREVERTASNGLRFSGGGRSVTLFTQ
jgi:hypothetical protein